MFVKAVLASISCTVQHHTPIQPIAAFVNAPGNQHQRHQQHGEVTCWSVRAGLTIQAPPAKPGAYIPP